MNRKITPYLAAALLVLGLLAFLSERPRRSGTAAPRRTAAVLNVRSEDILRLRMKKDFWNSYMMAKDEAGRWMMEEPSRGRVDESEARKLLEAVSYLPIIRVIDMPGDDSQLRHEYGLWTPSLEITISMPGGATTLMFGSRTPDGSGVYVTIHGKPRAYVVPLATFEVLERGAETYLKAP